MTASNETRDGPTPTERVYLDQVPAGFTGDSWWARYATTLVSLSETSGTVLELDCAYIVDRGVFGSGVPDPAVWPTNRVRRGLVMGSVQSGKTASMLGVAALALDRGVDILVILTGTRLSLWRQTYGRLRSQLDSGPDSADKERRRILLPVPGAESSSAGTIPLAALYRMSPAQVRRALRTRQPIIVVAMKQTDHLRALGRSLRDAVFPSFDARPTPVHMLVLDDEADDGSVMDARIEASQDPVYGNLKQIPRAVADLWAPPSLGSGPAKLFTSYVGYTATPQANFLQEEHNPLAPREFVVSLRTPLDRGSAVPRSSTFAEPRGIERYYTGGEVYYRRGGRAGLCVASSNNPGDDLAESIRAFLVAGAIRLFRSSGRLGPRAAAEVEFESRDAVLDAVIQPHSMLVHPSALVGEHFAAAEGILQWAGLDGQSAARSLLDGSNAYLPAALSSQLDAEEEKWAIWLERYRASAEEIHLEFNTAGTRSIPGWETVKNLLKTEIIPGTRVAVVNSDPSADDRPEYEPTRNTNETWRSPRDLSTIFVSGNIMARGLTLEGLTTTLFLRSSSQPFADTQMQMQRWFGYRGAYIELCRLFAPQVQLDFFASYHDVDEALRLVLTDAMREDGTAPDPAVLQGRGFLATGKIANLGNQPLCPGPKPFVRLINSGVHEDPNSQLVGDLFGAGLSVDVIASSRVRGRILAAPISLDAAAEVLDRLIFDSYHPGDDNWQGLIWSQIQARVAAIQALPDGGPLYRPPAPPHGDASLVRRDDPYAIAAYMRLWSACLSRHVRGLFATDGPTRQWSMVDLTAKSRQQPQFWVGIRYGGGDPVSRGPLAKLPFTIPVANRTVIGDQIAATWGSNDPGAGPHGYRGDEYFDFYHRGEQIPSVLSNEPPWRPPGSDGQILFYVNQSSGQAHPTIAVGVSIPIGGPDQFAATVSTPFVPVSV